MNSLKGVSECIIMGIPMRVGTGLMELLHKPNKYTPPESRKLLFDCKKFRLPEFSTWDHFCQASFFIRFYSYYQIVPDISMENINHMPTYKWTLLANIYYVLYVLSAKY